MPAYTNQEKVEAYLNRELTPSELLLLDDLIEYFSNFINSYTSREWLDIDGGYNDGVEDTERLYDGNGQRELFIDDFLELTEVELLDSQGGIAQTLDDADDFVSSPLNDLPKESIYLRNHRFPFGMGNVRVTAAFSSGEVPTGVIIVCTTLVASFISGIVISTGTFKKESIEGYAYELMDSKTGDTDVVASLAQLDNYKKVNL